MLSKNCRKLLGVLEIAQMYCILFALCLPSYHWHFGHNSEVGAGMGMCKSFSTVLDTYYVTDTMLDIGAMTMKIPCPQGTYSLIRNGRKFLINFNRADGIKRKSTAHHESI